MPTPAVVPAAVYRVGDPLHAALRRYKDSPVAEARRYFVATLVELLDRFLEAHGGCLRRSVGPWDAVAVVPSSVRPAAAARSWGLKGLGGHPLEAVVDQVDSLSGHERVRMRRGVAPVGHLAATADGFALSTSPHPGARVLVVDDTWTTGAHARSAAACLVGRGVQVVAILVTGRAVDPAAGPTVARWWARVSRPGPPHDVACCLPTCSRLGRAG